VCVGNLSAKKQSFRQGYRIGPITRSAIKSRDPKAHHNWYAVIVQRIGIVKNKMLAARQIPVRIVFVTQPARGRSGHRWKSAVPSGGSAAFSNTDLNAPVLNNPIKTAASRKPHCFLTARYNVDRLGGFMVVPSDRATIPASANCLYSSLDEACALRLTSIF
jgi:hypothetical protein